jgi:hypothetical protein
MQNLDQKRTIKRRSVGPGKAINRRRKGYREEDHDPGTRSPRSGEREALIRSAGQDLATWRRKVGYSW